MTDAMPVELIGWIEAETGARLRSALRLRAGASRQAWAVDVERAGGEAPALFCLRDSLNGNGGSMRDAAVMRALRGTAVPVPQVFGASEALGALLVARVPGRSDFPNVDREEEREPTARDLMRITAALHTLEPASLEIPHLGAPPGPGELALEQLAGLEALLAMLEADSLALLLFAREWLERNTPLAARTSLVHGDMGPGNFLFQGGAVTAVVDWEIAHWGDPMEDLAAIAVRDMATPIGDLARRLREYALAGGATVDLASVRWYRVLVLARNSALIEAGLGRAGSELEREPLERFRLLLLRALALCLARETEQALGFADEWLERGRREADRLGPLAERVPQSLEPM